MDKAEGDSNSSNAFISVTSLFEDFLQINMSFLNFLYVIFQEFKSTQQLNRLLFICIIHVYSFRYHHFSVYELYNQY